MSPSSSYLWALFHGSFGEVGRLAKNRWQAIAFWHISLGALWSLFANHHKASWNLKYLKVEVRFSG